MDENRLTKRIFNWNYNLCKNWCWELNKSCILLTFNTFIMIRMYVINIVTIDNILTDLRNNQRKESLPSQPKRHSYIKFKDNVYTEDYIKYCKYRRSLIAQFR